MGGARECESSSEWPRRWEQWWSSGRLSGRWRTRWRFWRRRWSRCGGGGRGGGFGNFGGGNTGKRYNFTATLTARNAFNHVNYAPPNGVLGTNFFGESTSLNNGGGAGFGGNNGAAGNRKVEIQLRLQF